MIKVVRTIVIGATMSWAFVTQAHALNTRTWISGTGVDQAGCGPIVNPCRTLQYAHDQTSAGGEIDVKDSAGYGSVVITKGITIVGDGSLAGVLATSGNNAITVNAGTSDTVILRGLTIEGAGVGSNGIVFNSGGVLNIANCSIHNFVGSVSTGNGILLQLSSGTSAITNTIVSENQWTGLFFSATGSATASIVIDRNSATNNKYGISFAADRSSGSTTVAVSNSLASANALDGFEFTGTRLTATIGSSNASNNGRYGIVWVSATVSSFQNNQVSNNAGGATLGTISSAALR